ncbi:MAG: hypothetical protein LBQ75_08170 [Zoogloeaceae bacterium]|jgi:chromosome segregation ATPase|nr:hypothetical protein [Zoogloeaceae bacterium]
MSHNLSGAPWVTSSGGSHYAEFERKADEAAAPIRADLKKSQAQVSGLQNDLQDAYEQAEYYRQVAEANFECETLWRNAYIKALTQAEYNKQLAEYNGQLAEYNGQVAEVNSENETLWRNAYIKAQTQAEYNKQLAVAAQTQAGVLSEEVQALANRAEELMTANNVLKENESFLEKMTLAVTENASNMEMQVSALKADLQEVLPAYREYEEAFAQMRVFAQACGKVLNRFSPEARAEVLEQGLRAYGQDQNRKPTWAENPLESENFAKLSKGFAQQLRGWQEQIKGGGGKSSAPEPDVVSEQYPSAAFESAMQRLQAQLQSMPPDEKHEHETTQNAIEVAENTPEPDVAPVLPPSAAPESATQELQAQFLKKRAEIEKKSSEVAARATPMPTPLPTRSDGEIEAAMAERKAAVAEREAAVEAALAEKKAAVEAAAMAESEAAVAERKAAVEAAMADIEKKLSEVAARMPTPPPTRSDGEKEAAVEAAAMAAVQAAIAEREAAVQAALAEATHNAEKKQAEGNPTVPTEGGDGKTAAPDETPEHP